MEKEISDEVIQGIKKLKEQLKTPKELLNLISNTSQRPQLDLEGYIIVGILNNYTDPLIYAHISMENKMPIMIISSNEGYINERLRETDSLIELTLRIPTIEPMPETLERKKHVPRQTQPHHLISKQNYAKRFIPYKGLDKYRR